MQSTLPEFESDRAEKTMPNDSADVIVVGAGTAGLCAALAACESGAVTWLLEAAPQDHRGGNSAYAAGSLRFTYGGVDDILKVVPDLTADEIENTDFGSYTDKYYDDMDRVTEGRADPDLVEVLIRDSLTTIEWMRAKGVRFIPNYKRQSYREGARRKFGGGSPVEVSGGGRGLVDALFTAAERTGVRIFYETRATSLVRNGQGIEGIRLWKRDGEHFVRAKSIVIAAGGFESNAEWRARYLGPGWDLAKVRGTRFNTGDGIRMALDIGASAAGNWSGCHAVAWDLSAPEFGDLTVGNDFKKDSFQYCILVNADGERFLDEGADFRGFTYAKNGAIILRQPHQLAWQIFDSKVTHLLRAEYRIRRVTKVQAETIEALASQLYRVDATRFLKTVREFNAAVRTEIPFDPNVKDGRSTAGLRLPKSNWANTIDTPPFEAYAVTCGVTFTFGGLRISPAAEVLASDGNPIPGLFACGSSAGGLFYFNYPGGSGLVSAAVFGKIAGRAAATVVRGSL
jgi:tricarballylate dehydrogenase